MHAATALSSSSKSSVSELNTSFARGFESCGTGLVVVAGGDGDGGNCNLYSGLLYSSGIIRFAIGSR